MQNTPVKQNPIVFYFSVLLYMLAALLIRVAAFAPLGFLITEVKWLALLCPALLLFVVLPLRFSFAQAMVQPNGVRFFSFSRAFSFSDYIEKLKASLQHALRVLAWGLPLMVLVGLAYYWYTTVDALTLLQTLTQLGASASAVWCAVYNFFGGIFGLAQKVPASSALMEGLFVVLGVVAAAVLVWMYGAVRNSSVRYVWALAMNEDSDPVKEHRRRLMGRRWQQLGVAVFNMLLFVPLLVVVARSLRDTLSTLATQLMMIIASGSMPQLPLAELVGPLVLAFALLYLPLLPVRRWLTAVFACAQRKSKAKPAETAQQ